MTCLSRRAGFRIDSLAAALAIVVGLSVIAAAGSDMSAAPPTSAARQLVFDIPAQPLVSALEAYSNVTGIETLYDSMVARDRRSAAVKGTFTVSHALGILLSGSTLSARAIAPDAVTIEVPQTDAQIAGPTVEKSTHRRYFGLVQAGLEQAFCNDPQLRPGDYRAVLRFMVAANGHIREPRVIGTTGSNFRDREIARTLESVVVGSPPPADLPQPIMMVILPQTSGTVLNCASLH